MTSQSVSRPVIRFSFLPIPNSSRILVCACLFGFLLLRSWYCLFACSTSFLSSYLTVVLPRSQPRSFFFVSRKKIGVGTVAIAAGRHIAQLPYSSPKKSTQTITTNEYYFARLVTLKSPYYPSNSSPVQSAIVSGRRRS